MTAAEGRGAAGRQRNGKGRNRIGKKRIGVQQPERENRRKRVGTFSGGRAGRFGADGEL